MLCYPLLRCFICRKTKSFPVRCHLNHKMKPMSLNFSHLVENVRLDHL